MVAVLPLKELDSIADPSSNIVTIPSASIPSATSTGSPGTYEPLVSHNRPIQGFPRRSRTIDSLIQLRYSDSSSDISQVTNLGKRLRQELRPSRFWLDSRSIVFNRLEDQLKAAMEPSYLEHRKFDVACDVSGVRELATFHHPIYNIKVSSPKAQLIKELARREYFPPRGSRSQKGPISIPIEEHKHRRNCIYSRSRSDSQLFSKLAEEKTYCKIFAILVFIGRPDKIWSFHDEGICDVDLPFEEVLTNKNRGARLDLRSKKSLNLPLRSFKSWESGAIKHFLEHQWIVLAPVFENAREEVNPHLELHPHQILPFTWKPLERGGFGQVYETKLHPDHHNFEKALFVRPQKGYEVLVRVSFAATIS
ncbi:hypothetical protein EV356DRAFT_566867 [Viridothelium virens]|uniref:Protein kinase domain-containing protein n=1 Tax=Viridothelium virens TaxID=1048519 RepID=A0A6A6H9N2_VIRVR|nr:hypothetical protein EV356DRAFT_566867 [Viridothelium virens]